MPLDYRQPIRGLFVNQTATKLFLRSERPGKLYQFPLADLTDITREGDYVRCEVPTWMLQLYEAGELVV